MPTNEEIVRKAYSVANAPVDVSQFVSLFLDDGYLYNVSAAKKYRGEEVGDVVREMSVAFPDVHRDLGKIYIDGDVVVVELSIRGTHTGPFAGPNGMLSGSGRSIDVPCCDVWTLRSGKIQSFHCYLATPLLLAQIQGIDLTDNKTECA